MSLASRLHPAPVPACPSPASSSLIALLLTVILCVTFTHAEHIDPKTTLLCHIRSYQMRFTKPPVRDRVTGEILQCSGLVEVKSCWGRCDSSEVGDYAMPFRISNHPVCTYQGRRLRVVTLSQCDEGYPDKTVEVFDATACSCRICDSEYTSCENYNG